jgi:hypothetical protein
MLPLPGGGIELSDDNAIIDEQFSMLSCDADIQTKLPAINKIR